MAQPHHPAARAPRTLKTRTVVVRLTDAEIALADQYAAEEARSRASFIRLMFLRGIAEYEREHPKR